MRAVYLKPTLSETRGEISHDKSIAGLHPEIIVTFSQYSAYPLLDRQYAIGHTFIIRCLFLTTTIWLQSSKYSKELKRTLEWRMRSNVLSFVYKSAPNEPNALMWGLDCKPALRHPQTVCILFAANQNLSVFCANTKRTKCPWCPWVSFARLRFVEN